MSLVNIALASCVTMCLQSYFAKYQGIEELAIQVDSNYEEGHFTLAIHLPEDLILENEQELLAFVIIIVEWKKLFREDIRLILASKISLLSLCELVLCQ